MISENNPITERDKWLLQKSIQKFPILPNEALLEDKCKAVSMVAFYNEQLTNNMGGDIEEQVERFLEDTLKVKISTVMILNQRYPGIYDRLKDYSYVKYHQEHNPQFDETLNFLAQTMNKNNYLNNSRKR